MFNSFVKAAQTYFSQEPHGRKVEIDEFRKLTSEDRVELSNLLNQIPGFEHPPYQPLAS